METSRIGFLSSGIMSSSSFTGVSPSFLKSSRGTTSVGILVRERVSGGSIVKISSGNESV